MTIFALHYPSPDFLFERDGQLIVRLRVASEKTPQQVFLRLEPDNEEYLIPMRRCDQNGRWQVYEAPLTLNTAEEVTLYAFKLIVGRQQVWLDGTGIKPYFPDRDLHFHYNPHYVPARWVWSQIFYQIFPERFCDGDPSNNVRSGDYLYEGQLVIAKAWSELPDRRQGPREFYGGDLEGIRQKIPYLQDLGVTALYLNPIFASPSSHKYDTTDYRSIDPHFGSNEEFARLCEALREANIRLILDAVVNHTSERHPWFDRYGEYEEAGAYSSSEVLTRKFYSFLSDDDPESYAGWIGVKTLPVLDFGHAEVRQRIYEAEDAVLRHWLRPPYSIDGWRFDVIHMLGEGGGAKNNAKYVRHFRNTLREENPEAYVLGEHFFEATKWLQGDQEDGAMNYYGFGMPVRAFLANIDHHGHPIEIDAPMLEHLLTRARARLPFEVQLSQFNLLNSHDTMRLLTAVDGDRAPMKLAVTMLMTYIGVPCIYYGDEVGLEGSNDPDCRRTFPWDEAQWDKELLVHYQTLIHFRLEHKALQEGAFLSLYAQGDVYAFARMLGESVIIIIINRGPATAIELPVWQAGLEEGILASLFDRTQVNYQQGTLKLTMPAVTSTVRFST